jgi:hypothetical protein
LVFYRPVPDGIEVVRVLHATRNIRRLFEERLEGVAAEQEGEE